MMQHRQIGHLRRTMWILVDGHIAIAHRIKSEEVDTPWGKLLAPIEVEAHFVKEDGKTSIIAIVPAKECVQAPLAMIPECRRMSADVGESLGYR